MISKTLAITKRYFLSYGGPLTSLLLALLIAPVASADPAIKAGLVPHKALYEISLVKANSGAQIVNVEGKMLYEWESGCDGWISNHRFNLVYDHADTPGTRMKSEFSTYESFDGQAFNFTAQKKRNGALFQDILGHISPDKAQASYIKPHKLDIELPSDTLFPINHTLKILNAIHTGQKFYKTIIFDGSDEDGPVEINAFIGGKKRPALDINNKDIDQNLIKSQAHDIRLAFFPLESDSAESDYEMSLIFHENGLISDMFIEYDHFEIRQKLIAVEPLPETCDAAE